ncbi:MAG: EAL domain-containing protein [Gallionella sp.]|nr:EAL domain-containing protein [Gallionella sp.]
MANLLFTEPPILQDKFRFVAKLLLIALAYFVSARLGLAIPYVDTHITLIWLPTGIAVATLLRWGYAYWPGIFLGAAATNFSIDASPLLDSSIALNNTLGPMLTVWLLKRLKFHDALHRARDILFLGLAAAIGMLLSASGGISSLVLFGLLSLQDVGTAWLSWWAGDFVGVLLAAPLLLNISRAELSILWKRRMEFLAWCLTTLAGSWVIFVLNNDANGNSMPLVFMLLPLVVWLAMRFGTVGSSLGLLLPVVIAVTATHYGMGPFHIQDTQHGLLLLWLYLATLVVVGLMVLALQAGRNRAEDELKVALQHEAGALNELRVMLNTSGEGYWKLDQRGHITEVNDAYCHLVGYAKEEIIGMHLGKFEAIEQTPEAIALHIGHILDQGYDRFETKHRHRDGHLIDIEVSVSFITEMNCFIAFLHDISQRKLSEAELQYRQDLLNEAQKLGQLGSCELNLISDKLRWSDEVYRIFEIDPSQFSLSYENFLSLIHPDDRDKVNQAYTQSLTNRQVYDIEHRLLFADGRVKWVREHCSSEFDESGKPLRSVGAVQDITKQHRVAEELRIAAVAFETQEAILITDAHSNILRVNQAFQEISGYRTEDVIGHTPRILKSNRHDDAFYQSMWSTLRDSGKWSGEVWDRRKNGEVYPKFMTITAIYDDHQQVSNYVAAFVDISQRKQSERDIHQLAFYDPLTQLANRRLLMDRLQQAMVSSARNGQHGALLFLDLDHFKMINDTQGHATGDLLLIDVARRLQNCTREGDSVARLGGDEFVVLLEELSSQQDEAAIQADRIAENIRSKLNQPYLLNDHEFSSTPSIGITLFNSHQESAEVLFKHADVAMYQAKSDGRNTIRFFDPKMQTALEIRIAMETDLRHALEKQQFLLHYQVQMDNHGKATGAEVLLRWQQPERGFVFPDQFIPIAEETGLIVPIGLWVLSTACEKLKVWQQNVLTRDLTLAVNVSAKQFHQPDFVERVQHALLESGAPPSRLKLELTESAVLDNIDATIAKMQQIKSLGVHFSMDDFGTGYSSLQYLKRLPLAQIKIDKSFVLDITNNPDDAAIVQTIIAMSKALGLNVIAEGVETDTQRIFLDQHGCHAFQGYLFSKPLPVDEFEARLSGWL